MKRHPLLSFFMLAFAITWGLGACFALFPSAIEATFGKPSLGNPLFVVAVYSPSISAIVVAFASSGLAGLRLLLGRLFHWRFGIGWYAVILLGIPALAVTARLLAGIQGVAFGPVPGWDYAFAGPDGLQIARAVEAGSSLPLAVGLALVSDPGPLGEELGWRGFALPRLFRHRGWVPASILLGFVWGIWHLPAFLIGGTPQSSLSLPMFMAGIVAVSVLMAWVFIGTRGSVLATILVHFMFNMCADLSHMPFAYYSTGVVVAAATIVAICFRKAEPGLAAARPAVQMASVATATTVRRSSLPRE